jgi:DNA-binding NarL/FixJ family response regulator
MIRIVIVDDHDVVRIGLRLLLETYPKYEVVGEAADGREAITVITGAMPDVAVLDYCLPRMNGLEVTQELRDQSPETEILMFTMHHSEQFIEEVIRAGARGYLLKSDAIRELVPAIDAVAAHRPYFSDKVGDTLVDRLLGRRNRPCSKLSDREHQVVALVAKGHTNKEIAKGLSLHLVTVQNHRASAMRKLHLTSSAALVRYAVRNRLVEA